MKNKLFLLAFVFSSVLFSSCSKEGCTDPVATNYSSEADEDDGTCNYIYGCMDNAAVNYNPNATKDDGSCTYEGSVMFWTNCDICAEINVYIDNDYKGQVTGWYNSQPDAPNCKALYCLTENLEPGSYAYSGQEASTGVSVTGSFTVRANECTKVSL